MKAAQAIRRVQVRRQITTCTNCELHERAHQVPFSGPIPADYIVLGEAPGQSEDRRLEPFIGLAGRLMRRMLRNAGFDESRALFCNVACCNPWTGPPTTEQARRCRPNLLAQLDIAGTPYLIAAGATALSSLAPDGHVRRLHGSVLNIDRWKVLVIYHPSYVLREPSNRPVVERALGDFRASLLAPGLLDFLRGSWCVACERRAEVWDERGMPYCRTHRDLPAKAKRAEKRRHKAENRAAQGRML